jgi:hypothetical protein
VADELHWLSLARSGLLALVGIRWLLDSAHGVDAAKTEGRNYMKLVTRKAVVALTALAVASLGITACGGATGAAAPAPAVALAAAGNTSSYGTNAITVNVIPGAITMSGMDSKMHDAVLPSSWVVKKGQTFRLTAINYDGGPHSITAPTLGLSFVIAAGKENPTTKKVTPTTSTTTFVATKTGAFHWYCAFPCDGPTHLGMEVKGNDGRGYDMIMAGTIVVQA